MNREEDTVITRREIDAMADEELLPFIRKHHRMTGDRFSSHFFYSRRVLDEPYFLRRLCMIDPEQFVRLVQEQNRREYFSGGWWAAVLLSQGGTLPEDVLRRQEQVMPDTLTKVEEKNLGPQTKIYEYDRPLDSALFLEVSEKARKLWSAQLDLYHLQTTRCEQLAKALVTREKWLGASHTDSAGVFYSLGWKPLDMMLAYLIGENTSHGKAIDPDCALDAARRDPEAAAWLLDPDHYRAYFEGCFHPSYDLSMAKDWARLLYLHGDWEDRAPLKRGHRLKKVRTFYQDILDTLQDPAQPWKIFEAELRQAGLLPPDAPLDWESPKLAKRQRLALTRALVCHYQWRAEELLAALAAGKAEVFTSLLWGLYQEDQLTAVFTLDASGKAWDRDGQETVLPGDGLIGLVHPAELDKKELALWKKRIKAAGGKPAIRQLTLPNTAPDLGDMEGTVTRHITIYGTAGKWGMDMGPLSVHCRADLTDPLHGYGARIWFEGVWDGPEYSGDDVAILGTEFFRLDPCPFGDYIPHRAAAAPEELPPRFTAIAGAAFRQLAPPGRPAESSRI